MRLGPAGRLGAGGAQNPLPDRQDQAVFLGQGDEVGRRDEGTVRLDPAQQHLIARDRPGLDGGLYLPVQAELALVQGLAHLLGHAAATADGLVHLLFIEADVRAQRRLGPVHGQVGVVDQGRGVVGVVGPDGDGDAEPAGHLGVVQHHRRGDGGAQPFGQVQRVLATLDRHDGDELVPAQAGHELAGTQGGAHPLGDLDQQLVAGGVAVDVVDLLEPIQVHGQQGDLGRGDRIGRLARQPFQEGRAVGQAGQAVVARQMGDATLLRQAGAQVAHRIDHDVAFDRAAAVAARGDLHRDFGPGRTDQARLGQAADVQMGGVGHPARQGLPDQGAVIDADQIGEGGVGGQDQAVLLDHHAVDAAFQQMLQPGLGLDAELHVQGVGGDAGAQHHQSHGRHGEGQHHIGAVGDGGVRQGRQRNHRHGRHAGEVQGHDAQDHQHDRRRLARPPGQVEGQAAEDHGPGDGGGDIGRGPVDDRIGGEAGHARIVHRHHRQAEQNAAQFGGPAHGARCDPQGCAAAQHGHAQRQAGQQGFVTDRRARFIGDHGHEMGAPDRRPGRHGAHEAPGQARARFGRAQTAEQAEGDDGADQAKGGGEPDQPEVMVVGQAGEEAHGGYEPGRKQPGLITDEI